MLPHRLYLYFINLGGPFASRVVLRKIRVKLFALVASLPSASWIVMRPMIYGERVLAPPAIFFFAQMHCACNDDGGDSYGTIASNNVHADKFDWSCALTCSRHDPATRWWVCKSCTNGRVRMEKEQQLYYHNHHNHAGGKRKAADDATTRHDEPMEEEKDMEILPPLQPRLQGPFLANEQDVHGLKQAMNKFCREASSVYFERESEGPGLGRTYLAGLSNMHLRDPPKELHKEDIELQLLLGEMIHTLPRTYRDKMGHIVKLVRSQTKRNAGVDARQQEAKKANKTLEKHEWTLDAPDDGMKMRNQFVEGEFALVPNLPHPEVEEVGSHAYVSLIDCVRDMMAHGIELDAIAQPEVPGLVTRLGESAMAQEVLSRGLQIVGTGGQIIYIVEWSDDFDPNASNKNLRGSVWIKTVTISMPHGSPRPMLYTYPIIIGPKKESHEEAEARLQKDLEILQSKDCPLMFCGKTKKMKRVYGEMIASIQDQPERRGANNLMLGSSSHAARWGYKFDAKLNAHVLPSCDKCQASLVSDGQQPTECTECLSWKMDKEQYLLSYSNLQKVVNTTLDELKSQTIKDTQASEILTANCINSEAAAMILEHATNEIGREYIREHGLAGQLEAMNLLSPADFQLWVTPVLWNRPRMTIQKHIEALMHMYFLGIQKTSMIEQQKWLAKKGKLSQFKRFIKGVPESVQEYALAWCKASPYGEGKFGGKVSENYLADCRLLPWMFSQLDEMAVDPPFRGTHWCPNGKVEQANK